VTIYSSNLDTLDFFFAYNGKPGIIANDVIKGNGYYWIADDSKGLRRLKNNFSLNKSLIGYGGPFTNECFYLSHERDKLYVAAGRTYGTNWNKTFNWHGIYQYNNSWNFYNRVTTPIMAQEIDTISDIVWVTANPLNENEFVASSFGGGLLLFNNNQFTERFSFYNSSLQTRIGQSGNSVCVAGTCYDNMGNLWIANSFTNSPLSVKTNDGEWQSFYCGSLVADKLCTDLVIDEQYGYVWMIVKDVGLVVYDYNQTILDLTDDQYKIIGTSSGSGNLPSSNVNTLAIDNDGEIWIGTDNGPTIFYSSYPIFNELSFDAQNILIEVDGTLQYLLQNEIITDIVIDGANRKWIATDGGGLFLMSEDGTQTIFSLSKENSPLYSNKITSLAINNQNGELFIGTDKGIIGYRSSATSSNAAFTNIEVYPNPVRPDYQGNIAVNGLMKNAEVKITDASGFLIQTIFSDGGQAIWDGKDRNNQMVGSGIYYFFATSQDGYSKAKSKVLIVR
jgi:streptogramin lyase